MNILIIVDDQHRHDTMGCSGHPVVETPNLDALAATGTRFTQAVCNLPLCVPSRHSFVTGFYPSQIGVLSNHHAWPNEPPVPTLGMRLKEVGYDTAAIGKMHWNRSPTKRGFDVRMADDFYGDIEGELDTAYSEAMGKKWNDRRMEEFQELFQGKDAKALFLGGRSYIPASAREDTWSTTEAVRFIRTHDKSRPFCLIVSLLRPHPPNFVPGEFYGRYESAAISLPAVPPEGHVEEDPYLQNVQFSMSDEERRASIRRYLENVTYVDDCFGQVLGALHEEELDDNTLVTFFSDHGEMLLERGGTTGKTCLYDSSVRVPLIVRWPGLSTAGEVSDAPVELVDLMPTWLEAAGLPVPPELPGHSLKPLLEGRGAQEVGWRTSSYSENYAQDASVEIRLQGMIREKRFKLIERPSARSALYDLRDDPDEFRNLIDDPSYAGVRDRLRAELLRRMMKATDQRAAAFMYDAHRSGPRVVLEPLGSETAGRKNP